MAAAGKKIHRRSIATRTGDDGTTGLLYNRRVPKSHPQIEVIGALDELNAALGLAKAASRSATRRAALVRIQAELIAIMGELACAEADAARYARSKFTKLDNAALARVDAELAALEAAQPSYAGWATPGANLAAAALELARTTARRVERRLTALPARVRRVRPLLRHYLNRVSDLLWLMARDAESPARSARAEHKPARAQKPPGRG